MKNPDHPFGLKSTPRDLLHVVLLFSLCFDPSAHFRCNALYSTVCYQTLATLTDTCDRSVTDNMAPLSSQTQEVCADKRGTASVSLKTIHMDHACVDVCFDWHGINCAGWLAGWPPGKLPADNVCVCVRLTVAGSWWGYGNWKSDCESVCFKRIILPPCTFCSWIWALTTRYSADGGFWLATSSSVSVSQLNKGSRASWNFPQCNKASCSWAMRSATWRKGRRRSIKTDTAHEKDANAQVCNILNIYRYFRNKELSLLIFLT